MHDSSAKIKTVRPFNPISRTELLNPDFSTWFKKSWSIRSIEVGCGAGLHPISLSRQDPNRAHLAIERTKVKFQAFKQRMNSHSLKNLMGINEEAQNWLPSNISESSVDEYYFLYPNPYPKEKQANKRWHRSPFFYFILSTLKENGTLHFATNEPWYAEECRLYCTKFWNLSLIQNSKVSKESNFKPRTHFEKKYLERGQTCHDLVFTK